MRDGIPRETGLLIPLLIVGLGGCAEAGAPGPGSAEPVRGGIAVIAGSHDLQHMNPLVTDERDTADLLRHGLFLTLVSFDSSFDYRPRLAESWAIEGDSAVVFRLRRDVRWHDGVPTTARDVAFTFERVKDEATGSALMDLFARWQAVEAIDSYTVRFRIAPHPDPLYPWTQLPPVPAHVLDTVPAAELRRSAFNVAPVGNGPFRFVSHRENDRWVFEANREFPAELGGPPYLDRVVWRVLPESSTQLAELRTGRAHLATSARAPQLPALRADPRFDVIEAPSDAYAFIGWNAADPILADARVRRALTHAIDRQAILDGLRGGLGTVAFGPVPPGHWAHHPELEPLAHDTARAAALLAEAGWLDRDGDGVRENAAGEPLRITLKIPAAVDFSRDVAEVVRAQVDRVAVQLETRALETATLFDDITAERKRFQGVLLTLAADFRLDLRDTFHSGAIGQPFQLSSWSSPATDRLLERVAAARTREEAIPLWHDLQEALREAQPWTFLYYAPTILATRSELQGVAVDARGMFVSLPRWWLVAPAGAATGDSGASSPSGTR